MRVPPSLSVPLFVRFFFFFLLFEFNTVYADSFALVISAKLDYGISLWPSYSNAEKGAHARGLARAKPKAATCFGTARRALCCKLHLPSTPLPPSIYHHLHLIFGYCLIECPRNFIIRQIRGNDSETETKSACKGERSPKSSSGTRN